MDIKKILGQNIKKERLRLSLTQEKLAEQLGISAKTLSQIELGNNFVSAENLEAMCAVLKVSPQVLFASSEDEAVDTANFMAQLEAEPALKIQLAKILQIIKHIS